MSEEISQDDSHEVSGEQPEQVIHEDKPKIKNATTVNFNLAHFEKRVARVFSITTRILITLGVFLATIFILKDVFNTNYFISPVSAPQALQESGYTDEVIASRIFKTLNHITEVQRLADISSTYTKTDAQIDLNLEVVGFGIPIRGISSAIREVFGLSKPKEISGSLVLDGDTLILDMKIDEEWERSKVLFGGKMESSVNAITTRGAESILKHTSPYILGRHYLFNNSESCFSLGRYLLTTKKNDPTLEAIGYYVYTGGYVTQNNFVEAETMIRKGVGRYPRDLNLRGALSHILRVQGKFKESISECKKILTMIDSNTPTNRVANSYANLGENYLDMGRFDSAIYFLEKTIEVDNKFSEPYIGLSVIHLTQSDTASSFQYLESALELGLPTSDAKGWFGGHPEFIMSQRFQSLLNQYSNKF